MSPDLNLSSCEGVLGSLRLGAFGVLHRDAGALIWALEYHTFILFLKETIMK